MPEEIFLALLEAIKRSCISKIHLSSNLGEPLLVNNFLEKIEKLREAGVKKIKLTTNGIFLDRIGIDRILESGINSIIISTAPFTPRSYKSIYRSDEFGRMRDNVITLLTQNNIKNKPCHISISINSDMPKKEVLTMPETQKLILLADCLFITEAFGDWLGLIKNSMLHGTMRIEKPKPLSRRPLYDTPMSSGSLSQWRYNSVCLSQHS